MPATDPGPVGFCEAYAEHPDPIRPAAGSAVAVIMAEDAVPAGGAVLGVL
ncbi:hypothetical protein U8D41_008480 [Mycobacterium shigaense]|nr:hypothetical protein [Mycobacterium shigaense]MEA1125005.1 hypothetical protein [Mycobacterium shigaense]